MGLLHHRIAALLLGMFPILQDDPPTDADLPKVKVSPEETRERRRAWQGFPIFLWMESSGPELSASVLRNLKLNSMGGCNIEASQSSLVPFVEQAPFYIGHLAGKGDLHMRKEVFEEQQALREEEGHQAVRERPVNLLDPEVFDGLMKRIEAGIVRHKASHPLAYALDDEPSITFFNNPFDYSFDPKTLGQMNQWLKTQYVDLDHLNDVWGLHFESLDRVSPDSTDRARERNEEAKLSELNFASWADHREFMEVLFAGILRQLSSRAVSLAPGVPVGFLGGQPPSAFGGYDWWQLAKTGTFFEAYDHGLAPEMIHAFKLPGTRVVSTLFLREDGRVDQNLAMTLFRRFARGDDGAVVWSSALAFGPNGLTLRAGAEALGEQIQKVRTARRELLNLRPNAPQVHIYVSQPSVRAGWMLDSWGDGPTWVKRLSSYENQHSTTIRTREAWGTILHELGVGYSLVDSRDFLESGGAEYPAKVLILNEALALSNREVHELVRFVAAGGLLIADAHTALFDEKLRGRSSKALTAMFGVSRPVSAPWADFCEYHTGARTDSTQYLGMRRAERGISIVGDRARPKELGYVRSIGLGHTLYLNLDVKDWDTVADRRAESAEAFRKQILAMMVDRGELVRTSALDTGRVCRKIHLVSYGNERFGACVLMPAQAPFVDVEYRLYFDAEVQLFNPASGKSIGTRRMFDLQHNSGSLVVYRWERVRRCWVPPADSGETAPAEGHFSAAAPLVDIRSESWI